MIYLDSSALLKLIRQEAETPRLRDWLAAQPGVPRVSSVLAQVEVVRACHRYTQAVLAAARTLLAGLDLIPLSGEVVEVGGEVGESKLRGLDAIHLASALSIRSELSAFCVYDRRLYAAAGTAGLPAVAPGARRS
ncbi:MAG: type II toxin-antitoxin system VapC family toxin [Candidatus Dormibacteraceae bacterium]